MNDLRGPCSNCGAPLATDQRYCIECGTRVGPPIALPYLTSVPGAEEAGNARFVLPVPLQTATTFAAIALGFGVVIGTAISPNLSGIIASAPPVVQAPTTEEPRAPAPLGRGGGGGRAPAPASSGFAAPPVSSGGGSGGGGDKHRKKKQKKKKKNQVDTLAGVVVHVNPVAVSYTIASLGNLRSIHTAAPETLPTVGTDLTVPVRPLRNGTYAENGQRTAQGSATSAVFSGTVTHCADTDGTPPGNCDAPDLADSGYAYTVSTVGSSVLVRVPSASDTTVPKVGQLVTTTVQINQSPTGPAAPTDPPMECDGGPSQVFPQPPMTPTAMLIQSSLTPAGTVGGGTLEAVIQRRCPNDSEMILSADDTRESLRDLNPLAVGFGIDQSKLFEGQPVMVSFDLSGLGSSATFSINGIGSDHGIGGADDQGQGLGSLTRAAGVTSAVAREARKALRAKRAQRNKKLRAALRN
jgi:zinc-ribbon domain